MSREYNQNKLKLLQEKQKIREEKEAYEEAFYKLSNEEQIIIRKVEAELIQVHKMDCLNKYKLKLEQMKKEEIKRKKEEIKREKEEIKREKEEIKRLTKLIEDDRIKTEQCNKIARASFCIGVLAYVGPYYHNSLETCRFLNGFICVLIIK